MFYAGLKAECVPGLCFSTFLACGSWLWIPTRSSVPSENLCLIHLFLGQFCISLHGNHVPTDAFVLQARFSLIDRAISLPRSSLHRTMPDPPSSCSLIRAISASLRLTNESLDSLTTAQLLGVQCKLHEMIGIIDDKIQDRQSPTSGEFVWKLQGNQELIRISQKIRKL